MDEKLLEFRLCGFCRDRQGARQSGLALAGDEDGCFICEGMSGDLGEVTEKIVSRLGRFEFRTFSVGLMLPHGVQEREDTLRSELKIRGGETIKSELAGRLAKAVVKGMRGRKKVDRLHPDATVLVDMGDGSVAVTSKPLFLYGRYTKPRGVAQRRLFCEECNGRGCEKCQGTGLLGLSQRRGAGLQEARGPARLEEVQVHVVRERGLRQRGLPAGPPDGDRVEEPPEEAPSQGAEAQDGRGRDVGVGHPRRRQEVRAPRVHLHDAGRDKRGTPGVSAEDVKRLQREMRNATVQYRNNKGRLVDKKIYFVKASARGKKITAEIKLDGGLPVKRLVSGRGRLPVVLRVDEDAAQVREVRHNGGVA